MRDLAAGKVTKKEAMKGLAWSAGITGGICLILALAGGSLFSFTGSGDGYLSQQLPEWLMPMIMSERAALLSADAWRSLIFIILGAAVIWLMVSGKLKEIWAAALLGALIIVDLWVVDQRFFNADYFQSPAQFKNNFA